MSHNYFKLRLRNVYGGIEPHNYFKLRLRNVYGGIEPHNNLRVCASCEWVYEYADVGIECPRCNFGSYSLISIVDSPEDRLRYTSLQNWKEKSHLPDPICDWIIDVHTKSVFLENL